MIRATNPYRQFESWLARNKANLPETIAHEAWERIIRNKDFDGIDDKTLRELLDEVVIAADTIGRRY